MGYYISKTVNSGFDDTVARVTDELKKEGFGLVSEINIREKLKEKLGVDFHRYLILGACNPSYAHKALQVEDKIGTMLPCNVIVQEKNNGMVEVAVIDPIASMMAVKNEQLAGFGEEVKKKLQNVINSL